MSQKANSEFEYGSQKGGRREESHSIQEDSIDSEMILAASKPKGVSNADRRKIYKEMGSTFTNHKASGQS